jgi:hypothetical protein
MSISEGLLTDIGAWLAECQTFAHWLDYEQQGDDAETVNWLARLGTEVQKLHARAAHDATHMDDDERAIFEALNNDPRSPFAGMIAPPPGYGRK